MSEADVVHGVRAENSSRGFTFLGARLDPMTIRELNDTVSRAIKEAERCVIVSQNLHSLHALQNDPCMQRLQTIALGRIDGMPLILLGRLMGRKLTRAHRVTWVDWLQPLMAMAARKGHRIFFVGGPEGLAEHAARILRQANTGLEIATSHGYFDASRGSLDNKSVLQKINTFRADILIVGMGSPRQERWLAENLDLLAVPVILTSGAIMEYVVGVAPTPPRWMGRVGLEWLHRLASDPRRFWRRYLLEPVVLIGYAVGKRV